MPHTIQNQLSSTSYTCRNFPGLLQRWHKWDTRLSIFCRTIFYSAHRFHLTKLYLFGSIYQHISWSVLLYSAFLKPYKKQIYNLVDTVIFSLMGTIYFILSCHIQHILLIGTPSTRLSVLVDVLYTLPFLYIVCFMVGWFLDRKTDCVQRLRSCKFLRCFFQDQDKPQREYMYFDAAVPHRLLHPEQYELFNVKTPVPRSV